MNSTTESEQLKPDFGLQCLMIIAAILQDSRGRKNIIHLLAKEDKTFSDEDLIEEQSF